jgi:PAS domain S-box-containing protein
MDAPMTNTRDLLRQLKDAQTTIRALQEELTETNHGLIALTMELEKREERLRTVVTNAPILLVALDRSGMVTLAAGTGLTAIGVTSDQVVGRSAFDLYHDTPAGMDHVRRALAGETVSALERLGAVDLEAHWLPLRDHRSQVDGAIGVATDVTERRRAEQRTQAALDALVAMAEALVLTTTDQEALETSSARRRLAELTCQVLGCQHVAIVALIGGTDALRGVASAGFAPAEETRWWRQWDGSPHLSERLEAVHIARLRAGDALILDRTHAPFAPFPRETAFGRRTVLMVPLRVGAELNGILSIDHGTVAHDFTADEIALVRATGRLVALVLERERLLEEQAEARANELALRQANRRMEDFLSIAGHELRTPLTSVLGNVQLVAQWVDELQAGGAGPGTRHREASPEAGAAGERLHSVATLLRRVERQGLLLGRLVGDLVDTSHIAAGQLEVRPAPCDLAALVREAVDERCAHVPRRTLRLDELPAGAVPVMADAERIAQVLTNYLSNALKYSERDRPVTVGLSVDGATARVWVRDQGPGLAQDDQERIWEQFYQVEEIEHRDGSSVGLGLGLYISRNIVERHGGQVGVESSRGAGATFWFALPLTHPGVLAELAPPNRNDQP